MDQIVRAQLDALADHFERQRGAILEAWQTAARADPEQSTARALTRRQLYDHIPQVLDAFERKLRFRPGRKNEQQAREEEKSEEVKHGLHRWQQGYRFVELTHEWGHLQSCLFVEMETFSKNHEGFTRECLCEATRQMIALVNEAIGESAGQYERLHRAEAAGHVGDLDRALSSLREVEGRRSTLIHQAVHDLRTNVQTVQSAAQILAAANIEERERIQFATMLDQALQSVSGMLAELMELARLEAGQEHREIASFDAGVLVGELCRVNGAFARERHLSLETSGPATLMVMGDAGKVRRLLQNLVINALKYTVIGGVVVSWGEEKSNWFLMVKDSGPGILAGPGAPILVGLKEATVSARESDEKAAAKKGEISHALSPESTASTSVRPAHQQIGEGIGLSIVKRLCELLDASLEVASVPGTGTTFRVVFPRNCDHQR